MKNFLIENNAGRIFVGSPTTGWWDVTGVPGGRFSDDAAAIAAGTTADWTVEHCFLDDADLDKIVAVWEDGEIKAVGRMGFAARLYSQTAAE